jgi:hypothetical protein
MSLAPVENTHNDLRYWLVSDPASLNGNLAGFKAPDRLAALISEDVSDDGVSFDAPVFGQEVLDGVFGLMEEEAGGQLFSFISAKLAGRKTAQKLLDDSSYGVVGLWNLGDGRVALLAGDTNSDTVQELWDEGCRLLHVPPFEGGRVCGHVRLSLEKVQAVGGDVGEVAKTLGVDPSRPRPRLG